MWDSLSDGNYTDNGTIAVLHFHVLDTAGAGSTYISINPDAGNIFDYDFNDVPFDVEYGEVTIVQEGEETTEATTGYFASIGEIIEVAKKDFEQRKGIS